MRLYVLVVMRASGLDPAAVFVRLAGGGCSPEVVAGMARLVAGLEAGRRVWSAQILPSYR